MAKKNIFIFLLISFSLILVSCGINKNSALNEKTNTVSTSNNLSTQNTITDSDESTYELIKTSYIDKNVKINYPQITNLTDINKQNTINELIKKETLKVLDFYKDDLSNLDLEIDYNVNWKGDNLLSIQYIGSGYVKDGAYPSNLFFTTNINVNTGDKLRLKDLISIDENFVEKFRQGQYKPFYSELNVESEAKNELDKLSNNDLIEYFNKADDIDGENESNTFSYLTKDSLGISVSVPHAIGDHAEFEIKYQDINSKIKTENEVWNNFLDIIQKKN